MANVITWFEIPATDMQRAVRFYSQVLGKEIRVADSAATPYAFLPHDGEGVGGAIAQGQGYEPGDEGVTIYLNAGDDLSAALGRVEPAGGTVLVPKTLIDEENGYFAVFLDSEGNRVGLHSRH